jgi:hypothetical protein
VNVLVELLAIIALCAALWVGAFLCTMRRIGRPWHPEWDAPLSRRGWWDLMTPWALLIVVGGGFPTLLLAIGWGCALVTWTIRRLKGAGGEYNALLGAAAGRPAGGARGRSPRPGRFT